ncbi:MAG: molybdate ABC transporter substrate-binding protein [Bacteroidota bacterium]
MALNNFAHCFWIICLSFILLNCEDHISRKIRIATAANMQFAMEEIVKSFERKTGIECEMIVSSSGKLTAQIQEGAPFDVFVSADLKYPQRLFEANKTLGEPEIYAHGKLVLWSAEKVAHLSLESLQYSEIQHIALANPKTAPYGFAAMEVLQNQNLLEKVESKLVYGESIAQTNQFILSGAASLGFTAKSVVLSPELKAKGSWIEVEDTKYVPIQQAVVLLRTDLGIEERAKLFYDYLFSQESQWILGGFGYTTLRKKQTGE